MPIETSSATTAKPDMPINHAFVWRPPGERPLAKTIDDMPSISATNAHVHGRLHTTAGTTQANLPDDGPDLVRSTASREKGMVTYQHNGAAKENTTLAIPVFNPGGCAGGTST